MTELCQLAIKHKTDKVHVYRHNYTPTYYELFKDLKNKPNHIFEIGLGYVGFSKELNLPVMAHMKGKDYKPGASLYMWEEFFPNSLIYGADLNKDILFSTDRIKTFYLDQFNLNDLQHFTHQTNNIQFDIIIDDGSHIPEHQIFTMMYFIDYVKPGGYYVIEDVSRKLYGNLEKYFTPSVLEKLEKQKVETKHYNLTKIANIEDDYLIVFKKN